MHTSVGQTKPKVNPARCLQALDCTTNKLTYIRAERVRQAERGARSSEVIALAKANFSYIFIAASRLSGRLRRPEKDFFCSCARRAKRLGIRYNGESPKNRSEFATPKTSFFVSHIKIHEKNVLSNPLRNRAFFGVKKLWARGLRRHRRLLGAIVSSRRAISSRQSTVLRATTIRETTSRR